MFVEVGRLPADSYGNIPPKSGGSVGCIRGTIAYTDTSAKLLGELPVGAVIVDFYVNVSEEFNSSGTDLLTVGFEDNPDALVDDLSGASVALTRAGGAATLPTAEMNGSPTTEVKPITALFTQSVADADTGLATFVLFYTREES